MSWWGWVILWLVATVAFLLFWRALCGPRTLLDDHEEMMAMRGEDLRRVVIDTVRLDQSVEPTYLVKHNRSTFGPYTQEELEKQYPNSAYRRIGYDGDT